MRCLKRARREGATRVEVTEEANERYFAEMMRRRHRQIFWQDSCRLANSYYFDKNGDVPLRPATTVEAYWRSRRFDLDDYRFTNAGATGEVSIGLPALDAGHPLPKSRA